jgi:hypothetical protein
MTRRIRNIECALAAPFNLTEVRGLEQAFGFQMAGFKATPQTVSASTAFVNDADLWTELYGAGQHEIEFWLNTPTMTAAGGLKLQFVADQGLTVVSLDAQVYYFITGVAPVIGTINGLGVAVNGGTTNAWTSVLIKGSCNVVNGGVLQLQWAQQAASGATIVGGGSYFTTQMLASASLTPNQ